MAQPPSAETIENVASYVMSLPSDQLQGQYRIWKRVSDHPATDYEQKQADLAKLHVRLLSGRIKTLDDVVC